MRGEGGEDGGAVRTRYAVRRTHMAVRGEGGEDGGGQRGALPPDRIANRVPRRRSGPKRARRATACGRPSVQDRGAIGAGTGAARRGGGGQGQAGEQYAAPVLAPCIRPPAALSPAPPVRASFQCDMIDI